MACRLSRSAAAQSRTDELCCADSGRDMGGAADGGKTDTSGDDYREPGEHTCFGEVGISDSEQCAEAESDECGGAD